MQQPHKYCTAIKSIAESEKIQREEMGYTTVQINTYNAPLVGKNQGR